MMELGLIEHIYYKLMRKEFYERYPQTEKQYQNRKNFLNRRMEIVREEYKKKSYGKSIFDIQNVIFSIKTNVSERDYNIIVQDIENLKRQYKDEIPEEYWNFSDFLNIYFSLKDGEARSLQEAIKYAREQ